jgi:monodictyphenone polyketide synthase
LAGLGCGILSAAAAAVSPTLADLAVAGTQIIRIAFRVGVYVYEVSSMLEAPSADADAESWAYVIPGLAAETVQAESMLIIKEQYDRHIHQTFRER